MQQPFFEEDNIDDKQISEASVSGDEYDIEAAATKKRLVVESKMEEGSDQQKPIIKIPRAYMAAKKCIISQVEDYLKQLKEEFIKRKEQQLRKETTLTPSIVFQEVFLSDLRRAIRNAVKISMRSKPPELSVDMPETKHPICIYIPERNMVASYDSITGLDKKTKIRQDGYRLPDVATPILHENNIYLLDGCIYSQQRRVFTPSHHPLKIHLDSGVVTSLPSGRFHRMKCAIVNTKSHAYLLGGLVTENKIKTSTCERFRFHDCMWQKIGSLSHPHICASACTFNQSVYIFSRQGIEKLDLESLIWTTVKIPFGMIIPSYSFCLQVSRAEIAIVGGWSDTCRLQSIEIYNVDSEHSSCMQNILPTSVCRQRVSGANIVGNKLMLIAPFHGQINPQIALKKGVYQTIICWSNISQVKELIIL